MKPEAQIVAIAKLCRWTDIYAAADSGVASFSGFCGVAPDSDIVTDVPNYPADLNAMRDAEFMALNVDEQASTQLFRYRNYLTSICGNDRDLIVFASAGARAEALLRVWGMWRDE